MSDVYKVQVSIDIVGTIQRELRSILGSMEKIDQGAKGFTRSIEGSVGPLRNVVAEVRALSRAMGRLGGNTRKVSPLQSLMGFSAAEATRELNELGRAMGRIGRGSRRGPMAHPLGFNAAEVAAEVTRMNEALRGVRTGNTGASRSFGSWATSLERSAVAAERLDRALSGVRSHSGGSPVRAPGGGGGGGGGIRQSRHGGSHGFGAHGARDIVGTYPAIGAPTASIHYLEEVLKAAGGVDQVAEIQRIQGGLSGGRPMAPGQLNAEIAKNKQAAYALAFSQRYTDPLENMKTITDLADLGKGDYGEARHLLPMVARMNAITGLISEEEVRSKLQEKGQSRYLARGLDQMGVMAKSPAEQEKYFDAVMQGVIGTRGIFNGRQLFGAVQHSGGTATGWSPDFVGGVLPMFTEQMNGGASGDSIYMFAKHLLKGQMSNVTESDELVKLGLQKDSNRRGTKDFESGSIVGADVLRKNIYTWFKEYFVPSLAKQGKTSHEDIEKAIDNLSFAKNYSKMFHEMLANGPNIDQNLKRFGAQGSPDSILNATMGGQLVQLTQGLKTFGSALADPEVTAATSALRTLGESVTALGKSLHDNPLAAQGAFAGVAGLAGGVAAAGATALTIAAVGSLSLPALAVGSVAALSIAGGLIPWDEIRKAFGGVSREQSQREAVDPNLKSALDLEKQAKEAQKGVAEGSRAITEKAPEAKSWLQQLGDAMMDMAKKAYASGAMINQINFGGGGSGGGLIQKANFVPGGGSLGGGSGSGRGGGNGIVPPGLTGSDANMLGLISKYESHGRNVPNYRFDRGHTAQGYYQITNSNWRKIAPRLGITAPNAMSGTLAEQARVAQYLLHHTPSGIRNWSDFNPSLRRALQRGETYQAPKTSIVPPAPPPQRSTVVHTAINLDGRKVAENTSHHMFKMGNRPATGANMADMSEVYPVVG